MAIRLGDLCDQWIESRQAANRRPTTIRGYRERLGRLRVILGPDCEVSHLRPQTVRAALLAVKEAPRGDGRPGKVSERTVWGHHLVWRALFRWAEREEIIGRSPMWNISAPSVDEQEIETFADRDVRALLATQDPLAFEGARNRLMMLVLFDTGMRCGELVALDRADVDLRAGVLHVRHAKARRARRVPLSPRLRLRVRRFVDRWCAPALFPALVSPRLFTDRRGRALTTSGVNQWMRKAGRAAGITGKRVSPHTWRHTFATDYLRNGGSETGLQIIMGITTRRVLDRYVHLVRTEYAARQHRRASPLARLGRV